MEKEESFTKSEVFHLLRNEAERIQLEPKLLYQGGELDKMKNRILVEKNGSFVRTSFHLCQICPKTSLNRLIKVKSAVKHSLLSHAKFHEKSKPTSNPITKHFHTKIQVPAERLAKYHKDVALAMAKGNLPISFFTTDCSHDMYQAIADLFRLDDGAINIMKVSRSKIYGQLDAIENDILHSFHENIPKFIEARSVSISFDHYSADHYSADHYSADFIEIRWGSCFGMIENFLKVMPIVQKLRSSFSDDTINDTDYHKLVSDFPIQIDILKYLHKIGRGQIILRVVSQRAFLFEPLKGRVLLKTLRIFECDSAEMGNVVTENLNSISQ